MSHLPGSTSEERAAESRLRELYEAEKTARQRLEHRVRELGTALRRRHEQYLETLDRLQEREEEAVRRARRELSRSEERFRLVVESVEDYAIFLLDREGRVTTWNRGAEEILDVDEETAVGRKITAFRSRDGADETKPAPLERARSEGRTEDEGWRRRGDGSRFWASETITVLRAEEGIVGFVCIVRDLTERMEAQRALERTAAELQDTVRELRIRSEEAEHARADAEAAEQRMRFLADAGRVLSASLDVEAVVREIVRLAVPALAEWVLLSIRGSEEASPEESFEPIRRARSESGGDDPVRRLEEVRIPDTGERTGISEVLEDGRAALHSDVEDEELSEVLGPELGDAARKLGTRSMILVPVVVRAAVRGIVVLGAGASEGRYGADDLLLAEELVRRAGSALDNARLYSAAVEANRAKSQFLAVMSHELRTPLNAIVGYVDLLDAEVHGRVNARQREQLGRIGQSSRHLIQLIEEILSFSRLEAGEETVQSRSVTLTDLVDQVTEMVEPLAAENELDFLVTPPPEGTRMRSDPGKIRQILLNLLMNAFKFTERGHVRLDVSVADGRAVFEVEDTGRGIEEDELDEIFVPFRQGRGVTIGEEGGTGLGLSVTRDLARLLGGDVDVESEPGVGSTFRVEVPLRAPGGTSAGRAGNE